MRVFRIPTPRNHANPLLTTSAIRGIAAHWVCDASYMFPKGSPLCFLSHRERDAGENT